ncbi:MAG: hypothetical protein HWN66_16660 [Candidatus Helarchaeota archaeon]|nr:hypothetical protein [Candidatus Helarchaeota archaeon]
MLISKRNFCTVIGNTNLELEAKTGQGLVIKNIMIFDPTLNYITVSTAKTTVGYFRVGGGLGNHLSFHVGSFQAAYPMVYVGKVGQDTLLSHLSKLGLFVGYPVASGEKFLITGAKKSTSIQCVEYEIWDAADITPEMENGSKSSSYLYVNYGQTGASITVATDVVLNTANNPAEFPDFPYGNIVPANRNIELHGILASSVHYAVDSSNYTSTEFLKFMQGKTFLFDDDRQGLLYHSRPTIGSYGTHHVALGNTLAGNYTPIDVKYPFMFDPPIIFPQGQELTVSWKCGVLGTTASITSEFQEVGLILKMTPVS